MILPGAKLGVLGGGQLGRMFTLAARVLGYRVMILEPQPKSPAALVAHEHLQAPYDDEEALTYLGQECAAVTLEFENIPAQSLRFLSQFCTVRPPAEAVAITQNRITEKSFLQEQGFPVTPWRPIRHSEEVSEALSSFPFPGVLKRSSWSYDGQGQARARNAREAVAALQEMGNSPCVLEEHCDLQAEISVILSRGLDGEVACYPTVENQHRNGILHMSIAPARIANSITQRAQEITIALGECLEYVGVLAVEFFVLAGEELVINEIAPRPHNSGHYTIDACLTSQFEQQVRALCDLPLGETRLLTPAVMVNLLGDLWNSREPPWEQLLQHREVKLHLYEKDQPRPGRKMGHFTCPETSLNKALTLAQAISTLLTDQV